MTTHRSKQTSKKGNHISNWTDARKHKWIKWEQGDQEKSEQ